MGAEAAASIETLARILDEKEIATADDLQRWPAAQHMLALLYTDRLEDARMLYKRLARSTQSQPEVVATFRILQLLWQKDYQGVYRALTQGPWPEDLTQIVLALKDKLRQRMLALLSRSYSTIKVQKAAALLGMEDPAELAKVAESRGWDLNAAKETYQVPRTAEPPEEWVSPEQIQRLTEYVVHLESCGASSTL